MKALTICQPYAELIARGDKWIENRGWPTSYRGPLLIHAGKSRQWLDGDEQRVYAIDVATIPFGAIVAVTTLADCRRFENLRPEELAHEHANGPWCWILKDVRRVTPIECNGAQGLWESALEIEAPR